MTRITLRGAHRNRRARAAALAQRAAPHSGAPYRIYGASCRITYMTRLHGAAACAPQTSGVSNVELGRRVTAVTRMLAARRGVAHQMDIKRCGDKRLAGRRAYAAARIKRREQHFPGTNINASAHVSARGVRNTRSDVCRVRPRASLAVTCLYAAALWRSNNNALINACAACWRSGRNIARRRVLSHARHDISRVLLTQRRASRTVVGTRTRHARPR